MATPSRADCDTRPQALTASKGKRHERSDIVSICCSRGCFQRAAYVDWNLGLCLPLGKDQRDTREKVAMSNVEKLLKDHQDLIDAYTKAWLADHARRSNEFWRRKREIKP